MRKPISSTLPVMKTSSRSALLLAVFTPHLLMSPASLRAGDLGDFFRNWRFHRQGDTTPEVVPWSNPDKQPIYAAPARSLSQIERDNSDLYWRSIAKGQLKDASERLDNLNSHIKKWGHASVSQLFLFPDERKQGRTDEGTPFGIGGSSVLSLNTMLDRVQNSVQGASAIQNSQATAIAGKLKVSEDTQLAAEAENDLLRRQAERNKLLAQTEIDSRENEAKRLQAERALENVRANGGTADGFPSAINNVPSAPKGSSSDGKGTEPSGASFLLPDAKDANNSGFGPLNNPFAAGGFSPPGNLLQRFNDPKAAAAEESKEPKTEAPKEGFKTLDLSLSESDKLKIAASTVVAGKVLQTMADPKEYTSDKQVFMAVTEVSVTPGTYTRRGYACEVHLRPQYGNGKREQCHDCYTKPHNHDAKGPQVFAAFPLADAQTLDLAFGDRRQFQIMLEAAAKAVGLGQAAEANALFNHIKRTQQDVATRNPLPVVVPNSDGTMLSYRFEPSLRAIANPASRASQPEMVLPPMSIPALVVLVCEKEDLAKYDHLYMDSSARWVPLEHRHWLKVITVDWLFRGRQYTAPESTERRFELADDLNWVHSFLHHAKNLGFANPGHPEWHSYREIEARLATLEPLFGHRFLETSLPPPIPAVHGIVGGEIDVTKQSVVLRGEGFKRQNKEVVLSATINNRPVDVSSITDKSVTLDYGSSASEWLKADAAVIELETISGPVTWSNIPVKKKEPEKAPTPFQIVRVVPESVGNDASATIKLGEAVTAVLSEELASKPVPILMVGGVKFPLKTDVTSGRIVTGIAPLPIEKGTKSVVVIANGKIATLSNAIQVGPAKPLPPAVKKPEIHFPVKDSRVVRPKLLVHGLNLKQSKRDDTTSPPTTTSFDSIIEAKLSISQQDAGTHVFKSLDLYAAKITHTSDTLIELEFPAWEKGAQTAIKGQFKVALTLMWRNSVDGTKPELLDAIELTEFINLP